MTGRDADTSQSLPLSDERLLPPSRLTLLFNVCLTSLAVLFLSHISFCLVFCFSWWSFPPFSLGSILSYLAVFPQPPAPSFLLSLFSQDDLLSGLGWLRDCHNVSKSYNNSLYRAHWFNYHRQKLALLKAMRHRVNILSTPITHGKMRRRHFRLQVMAVRTSSGSVLMYFQCDRIRKRDRLGW